MSTEACHVSTEEKRAWLLEEFLGWIPSLRHIPEDDMARFREWISSAEDAWIEGLWRKVAHKVPVGPKP